jgi:hypothetical protein
MPDLFKKKAAQLMEPLFSIDDEINYFFFFLSDFFLSDFFLSDFL